MTQLQRLKECPKPEVFLLGYRIVFVVVAVSAVEPQSQKRLAGVLDNVLLPFRINPTQSLTASARARAQVLLDDLRIGGLARRRPAALSQGERQRVAIARALVTEPALILADEPTTGLDPAATDHLMELLERLVCDRGTTLVLVSHDRAVIERFEHRVLVADWKVGT